MDAWGVIPQTSAGPIARRVCGCALTTAKTFTAKKPLPSDLAAAQQADTPRCQVMYTFEGLELQTQLKVIPQAKLAMAWQKLSQKPLPKIRMLQLSDEDFNHILHHRRCPEDELREIEEWGRVLSTKGTDACIFNADDTDSVDYIILVRKTPFHTLDEIILHELGHIAKGDL